MKSITIRDCCKWSLIDFSDKYSGDSQAVCTQLCNTIIQTRLKRSSASVVRSFWDGLQKQLWRKRLLVGYRI